MATDGCRQAPVRRPIAKFAINAFALTSRNFHIVSSENKNLCEMWSTQSLARRADFLFAGVAESRILEAVTHSAPTS